MQQTAILLLADICNVHTILIGNIKIEISINTFMKPMMTGSLWLTIHSDGEVHRVDKGFGAHSKARLTSKAIQKPRAIKVLAYQAIRNQRLVRVKIRRYRNKMEALAAVRRKTYVI